MVSIIYGAATAFAQTDVKKLVAYSSVSHMGFAMLGIASATAAGLNGAMAVNISHGLTTGMLFLMVGMVYERTHTRQIAELSGVAGQMPVIAGLIAFASFASMGLPGLSGFVGEFLSLLGGWQSAVIPSWYILVASLGVLLGAAYMLWMLQRVVFGSAEHRGGRSARRDQARAARRGAADRADRGHRHLLDRAAAVHRPGHAGPLESAGWLGDRLRPPHPRAADPGRGVLGAVRRAPAGGDRGSAWVGAALALLAGASPQSRRPVRPLFGGMLVFDGPARFASTGVALLAAIWLLWTAGRATGRIREAVALSLFSATGAMLMAAAGELVTLVLALELATMPAYVLIGYRRMRLDGLEGALKYFLLSMLTSLVMLYGMSFLYGVTGTTIISEFDLSAAGTVGVLAVLLTFVGLFAKLSAAPFHYWAPDAYAGAEPWTVAFVSTVPKLTAVVALVRLTSAVGPTAPALGPALLIAAVASMVLGNLAALTQTDIRRMMAYSGVAHTGYLLLAVSTLTAAGYASAVFYVLAYSLPSLGVMLVVAEEGTEIVGLRGALEAASRDRVDDGDHARVAGGHPAARRVLRQAVPVRGRARRRAGRVGRRCGGDERRVGRLLPAHRARVVP